MDHKICMELTSHGLNSFQHTHKNAARERERKRQHCFFFLHIYFHSLYFPNLFYSILLVSLSIVLLTNAAQHKYIIFKWEKLQTINKSGYTHGVHTLLWTKSILSLVFYSFNSFRFVFSLSFSSEYNKPYTIHSISNIIILQLTHCVNNNHFEVF